ncbi:MAG: ATPase [Methanothrix harundinacea]|uniref:ATPase n=1 Tax=Methanothrix harundinacea TaxID=301375 RepID=A0A101IL69_9EURY|nr:MAG: ATPase [Methanothrix harundinacea]
MLAEKGAEFIELFREFADSYPPTSKGQSHLEHYDEERKEGKKNFEAILQSEERGEDVTDAVLMKLLPYEDTKANREMGYWISIASVFKVDVKKKLEASGWVKPEDWPKVAEAILRFVLRCYDRPDELKAACDEFSNSPYSKGFQAGTLTPILHALRPDDFILINNKSRQVVNYFSGTSYSSSLTDYPSINETARSLVNDVSDDISEFGISGIRDDDLFDMFTHWLVAIKKFKFDGETAEPFSKICEKIFRNRQESGWAFDLLKMTLERLGIESLDDERFSITIPIRSGGRTLHLSFGPWLVLGFDGSKDHASDSVTITLSSNQKILDESFVSFVFAQDEDDPDIRNYKIPIEMAISSGDEIFNAYEDALNYIANKFKDWKRSPWRNKNQERFAQAVFDTKRREELLARSFGAGIMAKNIWWVNQGSTLDVELNGGYIWAPIKSKTGRSIYHWDNLSDVSNDDIIIHYANGYLRYVSRVIEPAKKTKDPHAMSGRNWSQQGNLVRVDYHELKPPVALDKFSQSLSKLDINQGPLNNNGGVKQGYLFRLNSEGLDIIRRSQPETNLPDFLGPATSPEFKVNEKYPLPDCAEDTGFDLATLERWVHAIRRKGQAVLYGPPGTGKTYVAEHLARHLIGGGDGFVDLVQFHPAYAYEDFIQGIRPQSDENGGLKYPLVPGRFLEFCERAESRSRTCVLIIDEINRANLSQVFGELMYLLEYRSRSIPLAGGGTLRIPENVLIIGTMNTADRSIALVDHALRRRFAFLRLQPNHEVLRHYHQNQNTGFPVEGLIGVLRRLKTQINDGHFEVGISFFLREDLAEEIEDIWKMEIEPYLDEYFFDRPEKVDDFRWDEVNREIMP